MATAPEPLDIWFRPSRPLILVGQAAGILAFVGLIVGVASGRSVSLQAAIVLLLPTVVALALSRRSIHLTEAGMNSNSLFGYKFVPWNDFVRIDQSRNSYVFITNKGVISAGWIDPKDRERLFRKTLEKAKLIYRPAEPRWGLKAQFVRREQPISLQLPLGKPKSEPKGPTV